MSLVGDIIMGCREQMTDLPSTLIAPVVGSVSSSAGSSGPVVFSTSQTVSYQVTQFSPWGESIPTTVATFVPTSNGYLTFAGSCSYNATAIRVYFATIANTPLEQYFQISLNQQGTFVIVVGGVQSGFSLPPQRGSAWLPDTDGTATSASTMYRWLNDGLETLGLTSGGIRDVTGVPSTVGVAQYSLVGLWKKIDNNFFDGYPLIQGTKQQVFRHSNVTGLSGTVTLNMAAERQMVEFWPQPDRTAGDGVLTSPMTATDTILNFTPGSSGFVLGFGLALIGAYPPTAQSGTNSCELVYYSIAATGQLQFLQRGMGGTQPQAWPSSTPIQEVNCYMTGLRLPIKYTIGQAALILSLPPAWVDATRPYMLYRFRDAEQNRNEASSLLKEFEAKAKVLQTANQILGPRQVQVGGGGGVEVAIGAGSVFGGVILP